MMDTQKNCPDCGARLAADAPPGLCPACLMKVAMASGSVAGGERGGGFVLPDVSELAPLFPQLEMLGFIGRGGMGAVYRARQKELDRIVALKILPPGVGDPEAFAGRFTREAKALARLNHPGIVTIHESGVVEGVLSSAKPDSGTGGKDVGGGEHAGQPGTEEGLKAAPGDGTPDAAIPTQRLYYFIMEYVDGVTLRQLLDAGRMKPKEALAIVPQICEALQYAHDRGIVHRDIKPENILLNREGRVKVADFGLAKIVGNVAQTSSSAGSGDFPVASSVAGNTGQESPVNPQAGKPALQELTDAGKIMGTPQYMSPEQITAPGEVDHRADIYALGVVFYQMLTGELPGKTIELPSKKVSIDVRLDDVVLRALEKKPELRYQQASVLKTQVETIAMTPDPGGSGSQSGLADGPLSGAEKPELPAAESESIQSARKQVRIPAIGLMVVSGASLLMLALLWIALIFSVHWQSVGGTDTLRVDLPGMHFFKSRTPGTGILPWFVILGHVLLPLGICAALITFLGGWWMRKLRGHGLAMTGAVLAMLTPPGLLLGVIFGVWAIVVLVRREVRDAFRAMHAQNMASITKGPRSTGVVLLIVGGAVVLAGLVLLLLLAGGLIWLRAGLREPVGRKDGYPQQIETARPGGVAAQSPHQPGDVPTRWIQPEPVPGKGSTLENQPPVVVETIPASGAKEVAPGEVEIRVRFSRPVAGDGWNWLPAWEGSAPVEIGRPRFENDHRTCVLRVKLQPGNTYGFWINSEQSQTLRDVANRPVVPYLVFFQTRSH